LKVALSGDNYVQLNEGLDTHEIDSEFGVDNVVEVGREGRFHTSIGAAPRADYFN